MRKYQVQLCSPIWGCCYYRVATSRNKAFAAVLKAVGDHGLKMEGHGDWYVKARELYAIAYKSTSKRGATNSCVSSGYRELSVEIRKVA